MEKKEFYELAKNRNKYRVVKPMGGELSYAEVGNTYFSDTLFERGYNIIELCKSGHLELVPRVFDFERNIVGKNVHSVLTVCPECGSHGVNLPLEKQCGNCGYSECWTYYDAETINNILTPSPVEGEKEELRKRYREILVGMFPIHNQRVNDDKLQAIFDFFYSEILSRENANTILKGALQYQREKTEQQASRIKALEEQVSMIPLRKREVIKEVLELRERLNKSILLIERCEQTISKVGNVFAIICSADPSDLNKLTEAVDIDFELISAMIKDELEELKKL